MCERGCRFMCGQGLYWDFNRQSRHLIHCVWQSLDLCNMWADSRPFETRIICTPTYTCTSSPWSNTAAELTCLSACMLMHVLLTTQRLNTCGEWAFVSQVFKWKITDWRYTVLQSIFHPCISRTAPAHLINNGSTVVHEMPPCSPSSLLLTAHLQPHSRRAYIQLSHRLNRLSKHFNLTLLYNSCDFSGFLASCLHLKVL